MQLSDLQLSDLQLSDLPDELLAQVLGRLADPEPTCSLDSAVRALGRLACCSAAFRRLAEADVLWIPCHIRAIRHKQRPSCQPVEGQPWKISLRQACADLRRRQPTTADMRGCEWRMRFLPVAGGQDTDAPYVASFDFELPGVAAQGTGQGTSDCQQNWLFLQPPEGRMPQYPPLPWSLETLEDGDPEDLHRLLISDFPAHCTRRNQADGGWLSWNDNVLLWTVDSSLLGVAEVLKEQGNGLFRAADYMGAMSVYSQAVSVLLGGRQLEEHMQDLGFISPLSWSRSEGNEWPEHVWCAPPSSCCPPVLQ